MVPVPTFEKVTVPVPVPVPYIDHKKQIFPKKFKTFLKEKICFLWSRYGAGTGTGTGTFSKVGTGTKTFQKSEPEP